MHHDTPRWGVRYQIPLFFALAYALSWIVWGSVIAQQHHLLAFHIPANLAFFGVGLAAFVIAGLTGGAAALRDLVRRMLRWRVGLRWYLTALALPIALPLLAVGIFRLFGGAVRPGSSMAPLAAAGYLVFQTAFFLITEETAWRGFALPRLQARYSALTASVILGVLWGIWHTPLFLTAGSAQASYPYVGFILFAVAQSVLFTWIYNNSGGSVLVAAIFHALTDGFLVFTGAVTSGPALFWLATGVTALAAAAVVVVTGPRRLARTRQLAPTAAPEAAEALARTWV